MRTIDRRIERLEREHADVQRVRVLLIKPSDESETNAMGNYHARKAAAVAAGHDVFTVRFVKPTDRGSDGVNAFERRIDKIERTTMPSHFPCYQRVIAPSADASQEEKDAHREMLSGPGDFIVRVIVDPHESD
jgi:hypothetical protein